MRGGTCYLLSASRHTSHTTCQLQQKQLADKVGPCELLLLTLRCNGPVCSSARLTSPITSVFHRQAKVTGTGEAMYDQRLFNQEGGMGHGLTSDDAYNLYDKPMFADRGTGLHRAKAATDDEEGGEAGSTFRTSQRAHGTS